ncbi:hypothetical protein FACS1894113_2030 [Alphaproteobacteria bacterium]|nr:hypothetical protein FACS1894113_2030 [Alphaproteobacteria bacterium]
MKSILNFLNAQTKSEFLRIIISDDCIDLFHINNKNILKKLSFYLDKYDEIFNYLQLNKTLSMTLVISNKFMTCKSILKKTVTNKELQNLAKSMLSFQKELVNTVFYDKFSNKGAFLTVCAAKLDIEIAKVINKIVSENYDVSLTCWPKWIVSEYFQNFPLDENKFSCSLFTVERNNNCEIIVYTKNGIICYRNCVIKIENKKAEIENTIKYIQKTHKISTENIAIYSITDSVLELFFEKSNGEMNVICEHIDNAFLKYRKNTNNIIKVAFSVFSLFFIAQCFCEMSTISKVKTQIAECNNVLEKIDKSILSEINIWNNIDCRCADQFDFKELLKNHMFESKVDKIQNASIKIDTKTMDAFVDINAN